MNGSGDGLRSMAVEALERRLGAMMPPRDAAQRRLYRERLD